VSRTDFNKKWLLINFWASWNETSKQQNRTIYKPLYKEIEKEKLAKAEEEISEDFGLDRNYVILNVSEYPSFDEMKTWVSFGENLYHLNEISSIVGALSSARFNSADIALYVPKEDLGKINRLKLDNYIDLPERVNKFDTIHFEQSTLF